MDGHEGDYVSTNIEVGNRIRKYRKEKGLTQIQFARFLDISRVAVSNMETGKAQLRLGRLMKVSEVLEIDREMLFMDNLPVLEVKIPQHACNDCKYIYLNEISRSKSGYNPLVDDYTTVSIKENTECCGFEPGGVVLDKEQPKCRHYEQS